MVPSRPPALTRFVDALGAAAVSRTEPGSSAGRVARWLTEATETVGPEAGCDPEVLDVCRWVEPAVDGLARAAAAVDLVALGRSIGELAPALRWYRRTGLAEGPEFADGHANTIVLGDGGLEHRTDMMVGVTVMAPHVLYADHHHPPEEVYLVLSAGEWRQNAGAWHAPGPGGIVYNPPDIIHSMRSSDAPLLAVWMLPLAATAGALS